MTDNVVQFNPNQDTETKPKDEPEQRITKVEIDMEEQDDDKVFTELTFYINGEDTPRDTWSREWPTYVSALKWLVSVMEEAEVPEDE